MEISQMVLLGHIFLTNALLKLSLKVKFFRVVRSSHCVFWFNFFVVERIKRKEEPFKLSEVELNTNVVRDFSSLSLKHTDEILQNHGEFWWGILVQDFIYNFD